MHAKLKYCYLLMIAMLPIPSQVETLLIAMLPIPCQELKHCCLLLIAMLPIPCQVKTLLAYWRKPVFFIIIQDLLKYCHRS